MSSRVVVRVLALMLFATACDAPSAPKQAKKEVPAKPAAKRSEPAPAPVAAPEPAPAPAPEAAPEPALEPASEAAPEPEAVDAPPPEPEPVEPSSQPPAEVVPPPAPVPTAGKSDNPRDPSHIPAGTPAANAKAFAKLPVGKGDGPPIGGIGPNGIHIDTLEIGKGWHNSKCDQIGNSFTSGVDDKVNVCMRVIHPREDEELTIFWEREGKLNQRSKVVVKPIRAYLTRGWLPVTPERAGKWKATIKTADGTVLGEVSFEIK